MNKIWRNWLIIAIVAVMAFIGYIAVSRSDIVSILPAALQVEEKEWDHIAAGDRIEAASGVDVLHIGPIGGYPERENMLPLILGAAEAYFNAADIDEGTTFVELGATEGIKKEFVQVVESSIEATTRFQGYISDKTLKQEILTIGDLVDYVAEHFAANAGMLGATPCFHVSFLYKAPDISDSQYAVAITGYEDGKAIFEILEPGEYVWDKSDPLGEEVRLQWNFWTIEKWAYYAEHKGLFPPGKYVHASMATRHLINYITIQEFWTPLINAIFREAYHFEAVTGERFWNLIVVDYLSLPPMQMAPGIDMSGQPGYVAYREPVLLGSRYFARAWASVDRVDERHIYKTKRYYLDRVFTHEKRDLTAEEVQDILFNDWKSSYQSGFSMWGPLPYLHGFNHPWRADDMPT